ncbi:1-phosphofructokinase [Marinobacter sp. DUT-1]|uniref:1-phosphofructokinase n=1 Tax=Marinobacter sp. DUT-1 TaxID=3412037 RepID=UPI003D181430
MARILTITLNPALDLNVELERMQPGAVNRATETRLVPAGKGINVARVLARLGHRVTVSGLLGEANAGVFEQLFIDEELEDSFVRVPGQTRTNIKLADAGGQVTEINGPGFAVPADIRNRLKQHLTLLVTDCDAMIVAGSLPPGLPAKAVADLVGLGHETGKPVWLDASGDALAQGLTAAPYGIKPNLEELSGWVGQPLADDEAINAAIRRLQGAGVRHAVVSLGSDGVRWWSGSESRAATPPEVSVANTVCAGDTLLAGMVHGLLTTPEQPEQVLGYATALSAECVRHVGVGEPDAPDFQSLFEQTRITPWPGNNNIGEMPS